MCCSQGKGVFCKMGCKLKGLYHRFQAILVVHSLCSNPVLVQEQGGNNMGCYCRALAEEREFVSGQLSNY